MTNQPEASCEVCGRVGGKCVPSLIDPKCKAVIQRAMKVADLKADLTELRQLALDVAQEALEQRLDELDAREAALVSAPQLPKEEA